MSSIDQQPTNATPERQYSKYFYKEKNFTKEILALAIPVALQNLISAVLNIFDQIMVGMLPPDIADACLSAVVVVNQIVLIYSIVLFAASNTSNLFIAQYTDESRKSLIPNRVGKALAIGLLFGVACTVLGVVGSQLLVGLFDLSESYRIYAEQFLSVVAWSFIPMAVSTTIAFVLRAIKRMRIVLIANIIGVVMNIAFNYMLMFGVGDFIPAYGFIGAAYGTIIARAIEMVIIVVALIWRKYPIFAKPSVMFRWDKQFNKQFYAMFFPILINEITWSLSNAVFLSVFDKQPNSEVVLAAYNITSTVDRIIFVVLIGICASACIILGNTIAEKDYKKINITAKYCIQFSTVAGIVVGLLTFASAFLAPLAFVNASVEAKEMATNMLFIFAAATVPRAWSFMIIVGILRSGGDTTFCMIAEAAVIWALAVPLVCVGGLLLNWNVYILLGIIMAAELVKSYVCYLRIKSKKWVKLIA